jgi:hypothetical protein
MLKRKMAIVLSGLLTYMLVLYADTYPAPTGLDDSDATDRNITLEWSETKDAVGYSIYEVAGKPKTGYIYSLIGSIPAERLPSYVVTTLPSGGIDADSSYRFAVTAAYDVSGDIIESDYTAPITAETTHVWSGALQKCVNNALGNGNPGHIPTRVELEGLDEFNCTTAGVSKMDPVEDLKNLKRLDLYYNDITGAIPLWIGNLSKLVYLNLEMNYLSGSIPVEIFDLSNLTHLNLERNLLSGSIPHEIGQLTKLIRLRLQDNRLTGSIPAEISNLKNTLRTLYLHINHLSGPIPDEIKELTNLELQYGLFLDNNCHLYSDNEELKTFIDSRSSAGSSYQTILDTNGHCLVLVPITSYLMD